jgi:hypothetical protein
MVATWTGTPLLPTQMLWIVLPGFFFIESSSVVKQTYNDEDKDDYEYRRHDVIDIFFIFFITHKR